jgi:predicted ATPase
MLVEAHGVLGQTLFWIGEFSLAWTNVEQALALYDRRQHAALASLSGYDPGVASLCRAMWILWVLGYPERALQKSREAVTLAQDLGHPQSLVLALDFASFLHMFRRDWKIVQDFAEAVISLSTEHGFAQFLVLSEFKKGWTLAESGERETGNRRMLASLEKWQQTGTRLGLQYCFVPLAESYGKAGYIDDGIDILERGFALVEENEGRSHESELYRLKGQLTLQKGIRDWGLGTGSSSPQAGSLKPQDPSGVVEEAEGYFLKAIHIAQQQQAKSLELRATVSLARLWQQQRKTNEAHQMLSTIYNWFTEGFDTKDLQEAKALLSELRER